MVNDAYYFVFNFNGNYYSGVFIVYYIFGGAHPNVRG